MDGFDANDESRYCWAALELILFERRFFGCDAKIIKRVELGHSAIEFIVIPRSCISDNSLDEERFEGDTPRWQNLMTSSIWSHEFYEYAIPPPTIVHSEDR